MVKNIPSFLPYFLIYFRAIMTGGMNKRIQVSILCKNRSRTDTSLENLRNFCAYV